jgi:hypothetical protein
VRDPLALKARCSAASGDPHLLKGYGFSGSGTVPS